MLLSIKRKVLELEEALFAAIKEYGPIVFMAIFCFVLMHMSQKKNIDALKEQHNVTIKELRNVFESSVNTIGDIYKTSKI